LLSTEVALTKIISFVSSFQIPLDLDNIPIPVDTDTLVVIIEQFLMLILIIGRWMLPKGDLTRSKFCKIFGDAFLLQVQKLKNQLLFIFVDEINKDFVQICQILHQQ